MHPYASLWTIFHGPDLGTWTAAKWAAWRADMAICFPPGWEPETEPALTRAERLDEAAWLDSVGLHEMAADVLVRTKG